MFMNNKRILFDASNKTKDLAGIYIKQDLLVVQDVGRHLLLEGVVLDQRIVLFDPPM